MLMLLVLFVFIYALIGMQFFGGRFTDPGVVGTVQYNYDHFSYAIVTSFGMLTTSNWNNTFYFAYSSTVPEPLIAVYFVSLIFVGNWMLLNLLLSILLDSFAAVEEDDIITPEKKDRIR